MSAFRAGPSVTALLAALVLGGCGDTAMQAERAYDGDESEAVQNVELPTGGYADADATVPRPAPAPPRPAPSADRPQAAPSDMIVRTAEARVEVDSLEPAVDALRDLAADMGGFTTNISMRTGREERREARVQLRIPSGRFDAALDGLAPLGEVEAVSVSAEDVGEQFVDVQARVANHRRLEERLVDLLDERTGDLDDVLAVERELARVREAIERQEGRLRYLSDRVALSTLTVTVHEPTPLVAAYRGDNVILNAFGTAWRNFVLVVATLIAALGVVLPLGIVVTLGWLVVHRIRTGAWPGRARRTG